jgi:hypothetical protein
MKLCPEAHQHCTWLNPKADDWPSCINNPMCGYWWSLIKANNP